MADILRWRGWGKVLFVTVLATTASGGPASAKMPALATEQLVARLTFSEHAEALANVHLAANEIWRDAEHPARSDFETDEVSFYRSVHIESMQSEKGKPLSEVALARQASARSRVEKRVDALWANNPDAGRLVNLDGEIWTLDQIAAHYAWTAIPAGTVAGRRAVDLHFEPLPDQHAGSRIERVLAGTVGDLTVDEESGQILRGDFHSLGEVLYGGGWLAHIAFSGTFTMQAAGECWVMQNVRVDVQGRELFSLLHGTQINTYQVTPEPVAASPPHAAAGAGR